MTKRTDKPIVTEPTASRLSLKRETLRTLTTDELQLVAGGGIRTRRCAC